MYEIRMMLVKLVVFSCVVIISPLIFVASCVVRFNYFPSAWGAAKHSISLCEKTLTVKSYTDKSLKAYLATQFLGLPFTAYQVSNNLRVPPEIIFVRLKELMNQGWLNPIDVIRVGGSVLYSTDTDGYQMTFAFNDRTKKEIANSEICRLINYSKGNEINPALIRDMTSCDEMTANLLLRYGVEAGYLAGERGIGGESCYRVKRGKEILTLVK